MTTRTRRAIVEDDFAVHVASYHRALRAENRSAATIAAYKKATDQLYAFQVDHGMPVTVSAIRREHIEMFMESIQSRLAEATVSQRFRSLASFFRWLVLNDYLTANPMARMRRPRVSSTPVPVLTDDQLGALLATCSGRSFRDRRDTAIIAMFWTSGMRLSELANIELEHIDLDRHQVRVRGKGSRYRDTTYSLEAAAKLDRYLMLRARHAHANSVYLWLGEGKAQGRLGASGIAQALKRRAREAGITGFHVHLMRHSFAHHWLSNGGAEADLIEQVGWADSSAVQMLRRYGRSGASARAHAHHESFAPRLRNTPRQP